ncbi:MAG: hypothetical protein ACR2L3_01705, partial [Actinomycetota bacterium]
ASIGLRLLRMRGTDQPIAPAGMVFQKVWFGATERWLFAIAGFAVFAVLCMIGNIITVGAFFGSSVAVPLAALTVIIVWFRTKPLSDRWFLPRLDGGIGAVLMRLAPGLLLGATLFSIFILPALLAGSSVRTGDPPWHLGWTEQLLHGEVFPSGPAPEFGRNAYPWGLHAFMGALVRLVPGSAPLTSLETLHILIVFATPLAAACLVRTFYRPAGWYAAAAAGLIGGFGWLGATAPFFATSPSEGAFGADLVVASPNSVYELFPPGLPRELALLIAVAAMLILFILRRNHEPRGAVGAGVVAGVAGLISVPMFLVALVWIACASSAHPGGRSRLFGSTAGFALVVFFIWSGYPLFQAFRSGGFVNITPRLGMEWSLGTAFWSWGLLLPLALFGIAAVARRRAERIHPLLPILGGTLCLLLSAVLRGIFDWDLAGNATLLHQGRVWPAVHLLGAGFGGIALALLHERVRLRSVPAAVVVVVGIFSLGVISLVISRGSLHGVMEAREAGYEYASADVRDPSSFIHRATPFLGPGDVVKVEDSDRLAFRLFEFSGVKIGSFDDPRLGSNDLRIRYVEFAAAWNQRMSDDGFDADFVARRNAAEPHAGEQLITSGTFGGNDWFLFRTD